MALPDRYRAITLGEFNVAAAFLAPLAAQVDFMIELGLGPYQALLGAQLNAALAAQATLALQVGLNDGGALDAIRASIQALIQLQAAFSVALALPQLQIGLTAELSSSIALAATLQVQLGGLQVVIDAALAIKIPAIRAAAALNAGPFFAISFSDTSLASLGSWVQGTCAGGLSADGQVVFPGERVFGVLVVCSTPALKVSLDAILTVP